MKTINERLHNLYEELGVLPVETALRLCTLQIFKEWLTQKRQQMWNENKEAFPRGNWTNEYRLIDELLEELRDG